MASFIDQVAIVTGAGTGLGRSHALGLAKLGARVVVNDPGRDGKPSDASLRVVADIEAAGGEALADPADVRDPASVEAMVERTMERWGRIDILVNNAGILRDRSFGKMGVDDFDPVVDVHLRGSFHCTRAVWPIMRQRRYGRIVFTSSAAGLYGSFGQANYAAAKAAMLGLMNVLHLEGEGYGIRVNLLAPIAATAMTDGLFTAEIASTLSPEPVTAAVLFLVSPDGPSRMILGAGAGVYAVSHVVEGDAVFVPEKERTPERLGDVLRRQAGIPAGTRHDNAFDQIEAYSTLAGRYSA